MISMDPHPRIVIPAKAGIHPADTTVVEAWIPAFAGMTENVWAVSARRSPFAVPSVSPWLVYTARR